MKAYTRAGDIGTTCICGLPKKLSKAAARIDAIGNVDELNSFIGPCRAANKDKGIDSVLENVQRNLFSIGAELGTENGKVRITKRHLQELEKIIDSYNEKLPPLKKFILPRGSELAARLHIARTVCRRAERTAVALAEKEAINSEIKRYLNRLSSLLFVLARFANMQAKIKEIEWSG